MRQALRTALQRSPLSKRAEYEISLILSDNRQIKELNRDFRNEDRATDVLSFPLEEDLSPWYEKDFEDKLLLGDIVISLEKALSQAEEYGHAPEREIVFLFLHGLLHLLGYDHENPEDEEDMRNEQRAVLEEIGIKRWQ